MFIKKVKIDWKLHSLSMQTLAQGLLPTMNYNKMITCSCILDRCDCNQHGRYCAPSPLNGDVVCECFHNTMGTNCEQCLPLYNNVPWKAGAFTPYPSGTANECQSELIMFLTPPPPLTAPPPPLDASSPS